jgi:hypothetical protein
MIGNTIEFKDYWRDSSDKLHTDIYQGLVVDAFTEVSGTVKGSGKYDSFLGFGEGKSDVYGKTESKRIYKVQVKEKYLEGFKFYDVKANMMTKIISFGNSRTQEENEEKIIDTRK